MKQLITIVKNYVKLFFEKKLLAIVILLLLQTIINFSCKKRLEIRQDPSVSTPETLEDLQRLLDFDAEMNRAATPSGPEASADNYFITQNQYDNNIVHPYF